MKKLILIFCLSLFSTTIFAQQFSQYNTGTLFDSFENPAERSFIPDSSRRFASNFLLPNFDFNAFLTGDAQQTLKNRLVYGNYINSALVVGPGNHYNYANGNANAYLLMLKMFSSLNGNVEVGFFVQSKATARGVGTDETIALLNGSYAFPDNTYTNVLNGHYEYQSYNQFGFTYREQITKQLAFGIKLAAVSGMSDENITINRSQLIFDKVADTATLRVAGSNRKAGFSTLPFSNPGVSVSIGTTYKTLDGFIIQGNIKDLGFIHWNKRAEIYLFDAQSTIFDLTSPRRESDTYHAFNNLIKANKILGAYTTPIDGRAELSANKLFWLDADRTTLRYSPTLIASKELFYNGFTAAMVNPILYKNYTLSIVTTYNDMKLFTWGAQFMIKGPNSEFFIGSERLPQGINLLYSTFKNRSQVNSTGAFSGGDLMIGASFKFGSVIEHPMNASVIPMGGEKGFLGRLWEKLFPPDETKRLAQ